MMHAENTGINRYNPFNQTCFQNLRFDKQVLIVTGTLVATVLTLGLFTLVARDVVAKASEKLQGRAKQDLHGQVEKSASITQGVASQTPIVKVTLPTENSKKNELEEEKVTQLKEQPQQTQTDEALAKKREAEKLKEIDAWNELPLDLQPADGVTAEALENGAWAGRMQLGLKLAEGVTEEPSDENDWAEIDAERARESKARLDAALAREVEKLKEIGTYGGMPLGLKPAPGVTAVATNADDWDKFDAENLEN